MDATHKVELDFSPDRRPIVDGAELAWRSYIKAAQERVPVQEPASAEMGPALEDATDQQLARGNAYAEFEVHPDTGEVVVKIIDADTGKIVRTVPPDQLMEAVRSGEEWTRHWRIYI